MTLAAKITYLAALLIGLSIGAILSFRTTSSEIEDYDAAQKLTAPTVLADFAYTQYKHADLDHATKTLQGSADVLEEMEKLTPKKEQENDLAVVYTRLALREDAANNAELSHGYMTKALYWRSVTGDRVASESEMKAAVKRWDEIVDFGLPARSQQLPYDTAFGPNFYDVFPDRSYPGTYNRIEDVDFRNLTVQLHDQGGSPISVVKLKNGRYESYRSPTRASPLYGYNDIKLDSIHYFARGEHDRQCALVLYTWDSASGSSAQAGIAEIFELLDQHLTLRQELGWDEHFSTNKPYVSFDKQSRALILRTAHYLPGDAHGGVSAMDLITMQWNGNRFVKRALSAELSDYGASEGKKI
jgi:hypothetical protein